MLLDEIKKKRDVILALGSRYGATHIRVFGSVARREESTGSDVDFLVDLPPGYNLMSQRLPLTEELSNLLRRPVELIPEHELSRHIRDHVLRECIEL